MTIPDAFADAGPNSSGAAAMLGGPEATSPATGGAPLPTPPATSPASDTTALSKLSEFVTNEAASFQRVRRGGRIIEVRGPHVTVAGLAGTARQGDYVTLDDGTIGRVISLSTDTLTVRLFDSSKRIGTEARVWLRDELTVNPHPSWRGRVLNALGQPIDGAGPMTRGPVAYPLDRAPPAPLTMGRVNQPLKTGIRAIDLFTPICAGQRIGVFAGSGVGKTTLLSMLLRATDFDTVVLALVAERGREVREFIEDVVGANAGRTVTVVATSAEDPMARKLSAKTAVTIGEFFRDRGDKVLLVVDSITRYAHAARELALAAGEPPVARGYAPSVFSEIPQLLERSGPGPDGTGSMTGVYSVLVDGDDHNEPVADTVRGVLDGHIVLDRAIANEGRLPAIDVLGSISRLAQHAWSAQEAKLIQQIRNLIARYEDTRDLRAAGAYKPGLDETLDQAVAIVPVIYDFLTQSPSDAPSADVFQELADVLKPAATGGNQTAADPAQGYTQAADG